MSAQAVPTEAVTYKYQEHLIDVQAKAEKNFLEEFQEGSYTLKKPLIEYNLYKLNQLSAVIAFETDKPTAIVVRVKGKTPQADMYQSFPVGTEHVLPIVGLYADYENKVEIYPWQKYDQKVTHTIKTPKTPGMDLVESIDTTAEYMQDQVMFLSPANNDLAIAVDYAGDIRLDFSGPMLWDVKVLPNGNFSMGSDRLTRMPYFLSGIYEFSAVGKVYREYKVKNGYHHDQAYLPNGDIVALSGDWENGTVEDTAIVINPETGHIKKTIRFSDFLKPGAQKSGSWSDEDWFHCNAVWYDEKTNSLTLSGRHINAMVNIDYDTHELNWIISDPENWDEEYHDYLFTPVGDGEFDWQYEQHSNLITPLGDVMCFDNHHFGSQNPENYRSASDSFSRGVKYRIDTDKMEIEQLWEYGKERGSDFFSPYICNTKYYNEGHYLVHSGGIAYDSEGNPSEEMGAFILGEDPGSTIKSSTVEILHDEVVYELVVKSNYYRANKITLYTKGDGSQDLKLGRGQIFGYVGETPQMDYDIPADQTGEMIPAEVDLRVTEDPDLVDIQAKFEKGDLVQIQLDNGDEIRKYFVSTSAGPRGAMCAGTFLPEDDRDTRNIVTKDGLEGNYELRILINDKVYETGVEINV